MQLKETKDLYQEILRLKQQDKDIMLCYRAVNYTPRKHYNMGAFG